MKSDGKREEEIAAFRRFARLGLPRCRGALRVLSRIRGVCRDREALAMLAVADTVRLLSAQGREDVCRAVELVYFRPIHGRLHARDVTENVLYAARVLHCDERTVYRRLALARALWRRIFEHYLSLGADEVLGRAQEN